MTETPNAPLRLVCKITHNGLIKGRTYPVTILSLNGLVVMNGKIELIYVTNEDRIVT